TGARAAWIRIPGRRRARVSRNCSYRRRTADGGRVVDRRGGSRPDQRDDRERTAVRAPGCFVRQGSAESPPIGIIGSGVYLFSSRIQMLRKLTTGLGSPCACSLIGAVSYAL